MAYQSRAKSKCLPTFDHFTQLTSNSLGFYLQPPCSCSAMSNKRARYQVDGESSNAAASSSRSRLEDEEAELEAQLFGKKRVLGGSTTTRGPEHDDEVDSEDESDDEMAGMEDRDVSCRNTYASKQLD